MQLWGKNPANKKEMNTADAERSSPEITANGSTEDSGIQQITAKAMAAPVPRKPLASKAACAWPLPPPISTSDTPAQQARAKPRDESISLAAKDEQALALLQTRCEELGIKIKKNKLLGAGLRLLADAPTGKLLAILGPLETPAGPVKIKKKKAPPRV